MKKKLIQHTSEHFEKQFQDKPQHIFLSPGRINIIGEHIDYNDGFVLPAAINKFVCIAISPTNDSKCNIIAKDLSDSVEFDINQKIIPNDRMWINYILGVVNQFKEKNLIHNGFKAVFSSTVPIGAGLSSSAAVECGFAFALNKLNKCNLSKQDLALIGQKSEHTFVGVNCGIMDQFASVFGKKNHIIKLDCNTLEYEYYNADFQNYSLLLLDSKVKHTHLTSGYNDRRIEVEKGFTILKQHFPKISTFRDCTEKMVLKLEIELGDVIFRRCLFVVKEIQRVKDAVIAIKESNYTNLGELMTQTHEGLSKDYEVSCDELDFLVAKAIAEKSVLGARMMGGGFGGCSINLIEKGNEDQLIKKISEEYKLKFGIELKSYKIKISKGTTEYISKN
ncbi:MAG: galactokinase [Flavobacterium sp.]|nr:galactokinase [Flavobacterium sp.]